MRNYAMRISKVSDRDLDLSLDVQDDHGCEDEPQVLLRALRELIDRLSGPMEACAGADNEEVEGWVGGEFFYLEAPLPGTPDADIDVNIQGGRAYIRMAR
jgi:hypothetical protein